MAKLSFVRYGERVIELLALVHTDVCGLFDVLVRNGYSYFIIFIDDLSWYGYIYLMKYKTEIFEKFKKFRKINRQIRFFDLIEEVNILVKKF